MSEQKTQLIVNEQGCLTIPQQCFNKDWLDAKHNSVVYLSNRGDFFNLYKDTCKNAQSLTVDYANGTIVDLGSDYCGRILELTYDEEESDWICIQPVGYVHAPEPEYVIPPKRPPVVPRTRQTRRARNPLSPITTKRRWKSATFCSLFRNMTEIELWKEYVKGVKSSLIPTSLGLAARGELLARHEGLLNKLAWKMYVRYNEIAEIDDFIRYAQDGACKSYDRFNESKTHTASGRTAKLSTFVHHSVEKYILSEIDTCTPVHCPTQQRAMRAYLSGRYDQNPEKKRTFEESHGLTSPEAIAAARIKYIMLTQRSVLSLDASPSMQAGFDGATPITLENIIAANHPNEEQILERVTLETILQKLNNRQSQVYKYYFQQDCTTIETANVLGLTEGQVRGEVRSIRQLIREYTEASNLAAYDEYVRESENMALEE